MSIEFLLKLNERSAGHAFAAEKGHVELVFAGNHRAHCLDAEGPELV